MSGLSGLIYESYDLSYDCGLNDWCFKDNLTDILLMFMTLTDFGVTPGSKLLIISLF